MYVMQTTTRPFKDENAEGIPEEGSGLEWGVEMLKNCCLEHTTITTSGKEATTTCTYVYAPHTHTQTVHIQRPRLHTHRRAPQVRNSSRIQTKICRYQTLSSCNITSLLIVGYYVLCGHSDAIRVK